VTASWGAASRDAQSDDSRRTRQPRRPAARRDGRHTLGRRAACCYILNEIKVYWFRSRVVAGLGITLGIKEWWRVFPAFSLGTPGPMVSLG
jgi:hypothetical protein